MTPLLGLIYLFQLPIFASPDEAWVDPRSPLCLVMPPPRRFYSPHHVAPCMAIFTDKVCHWTRFPDRDTVPRLTVAAGKDEAGPTFYDDIRSFACFVGSSIPFHLQLFTTPTQEPSTLSYWLQNPFGLLQSPTKGIPVKNKTRFVHPIPINIGSNAGRYILHVELKGSFNGIQQSIFQCADIHVTHASVEARMEDGRRLCREAERIWSAIVVKKEAVKCHASPPSARSGALTYTEGVREVNCLDSYRQQHAIGIYEMNKARSLSLLLPPALLFSLALTSLTGTGLTGTGLSQIEAELPHKEREARRWARRGVALGIHPSLYQRPNELKLFHKGIRQQCWHNPDSIPFAQQLVANSNSETIRAEIEAQFLHQPEGSGFWEHYPSGIYNSTRGEFTQTQLREAHGAGLISMH